MFVSLGLEKSVNTFYTSLILKKQYENKHKEKSPTPCTQHHNFKIKMCRNWSLLFAAASVYRASTLREALHLISLHLIRMTENGCILIMHLVIRWCGERKFLFGSYWELVIIFGRFYLKSTSSLIFVRNICPQDERITPTVLLHSWIFIHINSSPNNFA
jgi:hypothetical protein